MRLITWNCARGNHKKLARLIDLRPDIAVIQETPRPTDALAESQIWLGENPNQGLLVLSFRGWRLERIDRPKCGAEFFLPVHASRNSQQLNLLAAWVKKGATYPLYRGSIRRALDYDGFLSAYPAVIVGDLNTYCDEDICNRFGLVSAYHEFFDADFGYERHATHFFRKKRLPGYHFDYCFVPSEWRKHIKHVEVGRYRSWIQYSDHAPVIVDITVPKQPHPPMRQTAGRSDNSQRDFKIPVAARRKPERVIVRCRAKKS